jgi:hypothetical protein
MYVKKQLSLQAQRGISLTGLILSLGVIALIAMLAMKVVPKVLEYHAAKNAIVVAKNVQGTNRDRQMAFVKAADINNITSLDNKDLIFTKVGADTHVAFDYEVRVDLFKGVALLLHFTATTDPSGVIPPKKSADFKDQ